MLRALKKRFAQVEVVGPVSGEPHEVVGRLRNRIQRATLGTRYSQSHNWPLARSYARRIERALKGTDLDVLVSSAGSTACAALQTKIPLVCISDTTFARMLNYYERYTGFSAASAREGMAIESAALQRADLAVFPTDWAAESAIIDHGADPAKVSVLPFGANLMQVPSNNEVMAMRKPEVLRLLFLGVEWRRKGGDLAIAVVRSLVSRGISVELTVCGCRPEVDPGNLPVKVIDFINKNSADGETKLVELMRSHHFLLLPTMAECFGIVFCEASACGTPSVTFDTGGVGGAVFEGKNGYRLPLDASPDGFADKIIRTFEDKDSYARLRESSRELFEQRLNWDRWGEFLHREISSLLA